HQRAPQRRARAPGSAATPDARGWSRSDRPLPTWSITPLVRGTAPAEITTSPATHHLGLDRDQRTQRRLSESTDSSRRGQGTDPGRRKREPPPFPPDDVDPDPLSLLFARSMVYVLRTMWVRMPRILAALSM